MNANVSIRVTPGSETLWSVHSGQRCCTIRLASSTRSWNRRSSRFGIGRLMSLGSPRRCSRRSEAGEAKNVVGYSSIRLLVRRDDVEREDQVAGVVGAADGVLDVDVEDPAVDGVEADA